MNCPFCQYEVEKIAGATISNSAVALCSHCSHLVAIDNGIVRKLTVKEFRTFWSDLANYTIIKHILAILYPIKVA